MAKVWKSIRISEETANALDKYIERSGHSEQAIIRVAIKNELRKRGIKL